MSKLMDRLSRTVAVRCATSEFSPAEEIAMIMIESCILCT